MWVPLLKFPPADRCCQYGTSRRLELRARNTNFAAASSQSTRCVVSRHRPGQLVRCNTVQSTEGERKTKVLIEPDKPEINRPDPNQSPKPLELPQRVHVRAPGIRTELATVERSVGFIDKYVPRELAALPRWTFARALLGEALRTRKTRDLRAAVRQLIQALSNEKWLDLERSGKK
jgi:hypothetical protein